MCSKKYEEQGMQIKNLGASSLEFCALCLSWLWIPGAASRYVPLWSSLPCSNLPSAVLCQVHPFQLSPSPFLLSLFTASIASLPPSMWFHLGLPLPLYPPTVFPIILPCPHQPPLLSSLLQLSRKPLSSCSTSCSSQDSPSSVPHPAALQGHPLPTPALDPTQPRPHTQGHPVCTSCLPPVSNCWGTTSEHCVTQLRGLTVSGARVAWPCNSCVLWPVSHATATLSAVLTVFPWQHCCWPSPPKEVIWEQEASLGNSWMPQGPSAALWWLRWQRS